MTWFFLGVPGSHQDLLLKNDGGFCHFTIEVGAFTEIIPKQYEGVL